MPQLGFTCGSIHGTLRSIPTQQSKEQAPAAFLTRTQADAIEARAAAVEARTGAQIVAAIVGKSDVYAELPWKAFALGAVLATLAVVMAGGSRADWRAVPTPLVHAVVVLGVGAAGALATVLVPGFARLFLRGARRDLEVRIQAESLFLRHGLFATRARNGVLILVSRFERKVEILADVGLRPRVTEQDWKGVIARMVLLLARGFEGPSPVGNELPDRPLDETGGR